MATNKKGGRHAVRASVRKRAQPAVASPGPSETAGLVAPADQQEPAPVEDNRPRRVMLDNTVPGGFRMEPV